MRQLDGITSATDLNLGKLREVVRDRRPGMLQSQRGRRDWVAEQQPRDHRGSPISDF